MYNICRRFQNTHFGKNITQINLDKDDFKYVTIRKNINLRTVSLTEYVK